MRRFYLIITVFTAIAVILVLAPLSGEARWIFFGIDLLFLLAAVTFGSYYICSGIFVKAICRGETAGNRVAITFDDGPDPANTPAILKILDRHRGKASFFFTGGKVGGNEHLVKEVARAGHTIGNHSYSHSNLFPFFRPGRITREIEHTNKLLEACGCQRVRYFRPPFGVTNPNIYRALRNVDMRVAGWSIRSLDTRNEDRSVVLQRIAGKLGGGEIILLHETSQQILGILEELLVLLETRGLKAVSMDELLETNDLKN